MTEDESDYSEITLAPRDGLRVFVNESGNVSLLQTTLHGEEHIIALHPDEVRQLARELPKFLDENFPATS